MTNIYRETGSGLSWAEVIPSSDLAISNGTTPLAVTDVTAQVQPAIDTVTTVSNAAICLLLGFGVVVSCNVQLTGVVSKVQAVTATVNLSDLTNLPLAPQSAQTGPFTAPDYAGASLS